MRATSERRRNTSRGKAVPRVAPAKDRPASETYAMVEQVRLHPDHEISAEWAEALGFVTRKQIARAFGVAEETVHAWVHTPYFPAHRAHLEADYVAMRKRKLYAATEVVAWLRHYRPAKLARARANTQARLRTVTGERREA
jgi:hypothetical protein